MSGGSDTLNYIIFWKTVNCCLRTITQEGSIEIRKMIPIFYLPILLYYFKIKSPVFYKNYLNPQARINKLVSKHTVDYHSSPSELISRIHTLIFLWTLKWFISPESFLNFFLYIPPWLQKSFRLLQIHWRVKKLNLFIFTYAPKQKSLPGFYQYPPGRRELLIPPTQPFLKTFFPEEKGGVEDYWVEKNTKINKVIGHKFWWIPPSLKPSYFWFMFHCAII